MVRRLLMAATVLLVLGSIVEAGEPWEFRVGDWTGGAFTEASGEFTHCSAHTRGHGEPGVLFAIDRNFLWSIGIINLAWHMTVDAPYDVSLTIDGEATVSVKGVALEREHLEIDLDGKDALFARIRRGRQLTVIAANEVLTLKLFDSSQILPKLLDCASTAMSSKRAPFVAPPSLKP